MLIVTKAEFCDESGNKKVFMKVRIHLLVSMACLILTCMLLCTATYAWLAMNRHLTTDGIALEIEASPTLIITKSSAQINDANATAVKVTFEDEAKSFVPTTHDENYTNNLKYVKNTEDVDVTTGLGNATLNYLAAVNVENGTQYYVDYTVYIASLNEELVNAGLVAKIESAKVGDDEVVSGSLMATSIDFYVSSSTSATQVFKGTARVATKTTGVTLFDSNIPAPADYLIVTMRVYFDGALQNGDVTYINAASLNTSEVNLKVSFDSSAS